MTEPDEFDYFALLDQALEERERDELGCADDQPLEPDNRVIVQLGDGSFHMCCPRTCPHVSIDGPDKSLVCQLTGINWGSEIVSEHDAQWTGRSTTSGDPDVVAGTPIGGWKPRKDAFAESQRAFELAHTITGEQADYTETDKDKETRLSKLPVKRGALCVDEVREEPVRRQRVARKSSESRETLEKLRLEAIAVCDKLTTPIDPATGNPPRATSGSAAPAQESRAPQADIRLQNVEFVTTLGLRKYLAAASAGSERYDMSRVHDIIVAANEFVRQQRAAARTAATPSESSSGSSSSARQRRRQYDGETKTYSVNLVLSLWKAVCLTPYVSDGKRGSESFRSFVAGVLYSLKRGLTLERLGIEVVPQIDTLADQLPTLRSADASPCARQLQSSSHRGLCTLHRAISSFNELDEEDEHYSTCKEAWLTTGSVATQLTRFIAVRVSRGRG
jgi:hypothetical protein